MGVDTKWLAKHFEEQEVRMSDKTLIDYTDEAVLARQNITPNAACDIDGKFYDIRNLVFLAQTQADRIEQLAAINEALIAERDEAWRRAAHSEKMWGETEVKLSETTYALKRIASNEFAGVMLTSMPPQDAAAHFAQLTLAKLTSSEAAYGEAKGGKDD